MALNPVTSNVVIVAHHFNPTITDQIWLVENHVVQRDEFEGGCLFTDVLVQVPTRNFHFFVVPEKCQFTPAVEVERQQDLISERLGALVRTLPHTPYQALGFNFVWHLTPENMSIERLSRHLFFMDSPLHEWFNVENARFGTYLSKESLEFRLKLDVKPIFAEIGGQRLDTIQFSFNYNRDFADDEDPVEAIIQSLNRWNDTREESSRVMQVVQQSATNQQVTGDSQ